MCKPPNLIIAKPQRHSVWEQPDTVDENQLEKMLGNTF